MSYNEELKVSITDVIRSLKQSDYLPELKTMSNVSASVPLYAAILMSRERRVNAITPEFLVIDRLGRPVKLPLRDNAISEFVQNYLALRISKNAQGREDLVKIATSFFHSVLVGEKRKEAQIVGENPERVEAI